MCAAWHAQQGVLPLADDAVVRPELAALQPPSDSEDENSKSPCPDQTALVMEIDHYKLFQDKSCFIVMMDTAGGLTAVLPDAADDWVLQKVEDGLVCMSCVWQ